MKKIPIRIAVVAGSNGDYFAQGGSNLTDNDNFDAGFDCVTEEGYKTARRYIVEAVIEVPDEELVFQGTATAIEEPSF
jgi:hypothetical protein